jgi:uncharacterized sulfatase
MMPLFSRVKNTVAVAGAVCATAGWAEEKPNILLILSDDQGYCELGSFMDFANPDRLGAKNADQLKQIKTCTPTQAPIDVCFAAARKCMPNMDRIAAQGMRFTSFIAAPTCAPSRAALLSSRYPQRNGVYCNDDLEGKSATGFPAGVEFPVRLFKQAGYMTGMVGKWHLGIDAGQHPNDRGFDYFFGFNRAHTEKYGSKILQRNGASVLAEGWLADQISSEAVAFVQRAEQEKKPFFLHVAYNEPHGPTPRPPQQYIDYIKSGSDVVDVYFSTIYGMDCGIGRILAQLEKSGQLANTLILYGSDNGLSTAPYHRGFSVREESYLVPVPGNGPLRGCKWTPWDGGVRVPFIAYLPGGRTGSSDALLSIMDVMPTALAYAGIPVPDSYQLDGKSFLPVLLGTQSAEKERVLFWACDSQEPFGDFSPEYAGLLEQMKNAGQSKIRAAKYPPAWYVRTEKWKLMGWDTIKPVLFDIQNDIGERHDVSAQHPEVVKDLSAQFKTWFEKQAQPMVYPTTQWGKLKQVQ